jgi:hypothetical protein
MPALRSKFLISAALSFGLRGLRGHVTISLISAGAKDLRRALLRISTALSFALSFGLRGHVTISLISAGAKCGPSA